MSNALNGLLSLLALTRQDEWSFVGLSHDIGIGKVFGGQVMGQALSAASQTVEGPRMVHSLHCYFLKAGCVDLPIEYRVQPIRDGRSVSTRRVEAHQGSELMFYLTASFQIEEPGLEHQGAMPEVAGPDGLRSEELWARQLQAYIPEPLREKFLAERPIEMRPVNFINPLQGSVSEPKRYIWCRANGALPDHQELHRYLLAYVSDFNFLPTALQPHGVAFFDPSIQVATIDHAMWFHRNFRFDEWLLYAIESTSSSGGRGLVRGEFYTRGGKLVASTIQEGVIRYRN
jgi:acyl-CoA thioesterase II